MYNKAITLFYCGNKKVGILYESDNSKISCVVADVNECFENVKSRFTFYFGTYTDSLKPLFLGYYDYYDVNSGMLCIEKHYFPVEYYIKNRIKHLIASLYDYMSIVKNKSYNILAIDLIVQYIKDDLTENLTRILYDYINSEKQRRNDV